jgi:hypothetical protein
MKKILLSVVVLIGLLSAALSQDVNSQKKDPLGNWKFAAPYAPEGYQSGNIDVTTADNKLAASMSFDSMQYKFPAEKVRQANDSLFFSIYLEGQSVDVSLKLEDNAKMSGKAVYTEGSVPLTLSRINAEGTK